MFGSYEKSIYICINQLNINIMYTTLVVNNDRYLINTMVCDLSQDKACETILQDYPSDADIHFEVPTKEDIV